MATNFPTSVDNFTNPTANDSLNTPSHSLQHANANDAIEAVEGFLLNTYQPTFRNAIINGDFRIWQRGTSITTTAGYTADRWTQARLGGAGGNTTSRQLSGLTGFQYCARVQRDSGGVSTAIMYFTQSIETNNSLPFADKTVTLSFYARAGANFSASGSLLTMNILSSTGTDQNFASVALTGQATVATANVALSSTWTRYTVTGTVASSATQLHAQAAYTPTGTAGAADYFEITGVQLEASPSATPFEQRPIGTELALCQRYYWVQNGGHAPTNSTTAVRTSVQFPVTMRILPVPTLSAAIKITDMDVADFTQSSAAITVGAGDGTSARFTLSNFTGLTAYRTYQIKQLDGGVIQWNAEL